MRYKKGSRVEILSKEEVPSGSWRCAEIIFGNGHNYTVRYDADESVVEQVSRKLMRPCPPSVEITDDWIPGEVLEVFHNLSWKMATVSKVSSKNFFVVRLVGTSQELKVRKFDLRVRQCWQEDEWIVIGKGFGNYEDWKQNDKLNLKYIPDSGCWVKQTNARMNLHVKDQCFDSRDNISFQEPNNVSSRTLKRGSPCWYSQVEAHEGNPQKFLAAEKGGRRGRVAAFASPEKGQSKRGLYSLLPSLKGDVGDVGPVLAAMGCPDMKSDLEHDVTNGGRLTQFLASERNLVRSSPFEFPLNGKNSKWTLIYNEKTRISLWFNPMLKSRRICWFTFRPAQNTVSQRFGKG